MDAENQVYLQNDFVNTYIVDAINGLPKDGKATPAGKTYPAREGEVVVFLQDGTRYSYYFESDGTLNINGFKMRNSISIPDYRILLAADETPADCGCFVSRNPIRVWQSRQKLLYTNATSVSPEYSQYSSKTSPAAR